MIGSVDASVAALATILVAALTAAGAYLVASRQRSGKVGTSEAADLWHAAEMIRKELRDEVVALRAKVESLEVRIKELEAKA